MKLIKTGYDEQNCLWLSFICDNVILKCFYDFEPERLIIVWADIEKCFENIEKIIKLLYADHFFESTRNVIGKHKFKKLIKKIKYYDIKATRS